MWLIFCYTIEDFNDAINAEEQNSEETHINFINAYHLQDHEMSHNVVIANYFAFTTLSTTGFGDFVPKSDGEMILCSFILLSGVAVFSYVMGNFIEILE
jgi:hypothetical protein